MCFLVGRGGEALSLPQSLVQQPWLLPWYSTCYSSGPSANPVWELLLLTSPGLLHHHFNYTFYFMSLCDSAKPGCAHTQRVKQLVPCLIYSCHPLIYKFHDAIKIKTLSFVLQDLFFTCPTLCYAGDSPPTHSSPSSSAACGLWSRYCLGN